MKVDFIIIGAQKCGTSSLAFQLAQHSAVSFCARKEPHHFSTRDDWRESLHEYHRLFTPAEGQLCAEASTSYTFLPQYPCTARRLYEYNPDLKLIYLMRQPVARIESQYMHDVLAGRIRRPPEVEVLSNPVFLDRSRYAMQIHHYLETFPRESLLPLIFEDYVSAPYEALSRICRFLGISVDACQGIDLTPQNVSVRHGHLRIFPGWKRVRAAFYRLPRAVRELGLSFLRGPGHRYFYRVADRRVAFPEALKQRLGELLEEDITELERLCERSLDIFRQDRKG